MKHQEPRKWTKSGSLRVSIRGCTKARFGNRGVLPSLSIHINAFHSSLYYNTRMCLITDITLWSLVCILSERRLCEHARLPNFTDISKRRKKKQTKKVINVSSCLIDRISASLISLWASLIWHKTDWSNCSCSSLDLCYIKIINIHPTRH